MEHHQHWSATLARLWTARRWEGPTFRDLAERWFKDGDGALRVCPENERRHLKHLGSLLDLTETELRPRVVKRAFALLRTKLGPSTVNKIRSTGCLIIDDAILNDEWKGPNPFRVVKRAMETKKKFRKLSLDEVRAMLPHLEFRRRLQALFILYMGPRPGEESALQKSDVDFRAGTVWVHRSNERDRTKTGKERLVPIPDGLWPWLEHAVRTSPHPTLVFPSPGGELEHNNKLSRTLRTALSRAGLVAGYTHICRRKWCGFRIEEQEKTFAKCPQCAFTLWSSPRPLPVRWYDLRGTSGDLHRRAGAHPLAVKLALGHATDVTESFYQDMTIDDLRRELNKLAI